MNLKSKACKNLVLIFQTTPAKTSADMTEKPIVKCEKGEHKIGDLRTKLSEKSRTKSNLPSSSTHSASSVRPATPSTIGQDGDFWRLYKPWAEQRCYTSYEIVQRHVNQMFLRGDNVVSIIPDQRWYLQGLLALGSYTSYAVVQKHANQLILRGDNVVSVIPEPMLVMLTGPWIRFTM